MRIGLLLPSIFTANKYLNGRIFAPLYPALDLANGLAQRHEVFFYTSSDVQSKTKAKVIGGDQELIESDPFYYQFRYRDSLEQKYSTAEIIKRDFEYGLTSKSYQDAKDGKLDIIHSYHDFGAHYFNSLTQFPTVYTLHDPLPKKTNTIEYFRFSKFKDHNYVSISDFQRNGVLNLNFVSTIYHGLRLKEFELNDKPQNHLIYFGRVLEDKGTDLAIEASLKSEIPIRIATSNIRANRSGEFYDAKVAPYIDGKKVVLHGFFERNEKSDFIKKGKAFIFPLRWDEPFGLTMIESMACGTPVIAYNRGSVSEIVRDGVTGFIIDPDEEQIRNSKFEIRNGGKWVIKKQGIEGLIEAIKRIGEIDRKACRKHVEDNFTVDKMVEGYERVYKQILQEKQVLQTKK